MDDATAAPAADGAVRVPLPRLLLLDMPQALPRGLLRALRQGWPRVAVNVTPARLLAAARDDVDLIVGPFGAADALAPELAAFRTMVVLRDPLTRLILSWQEARKAVLERGASGTPRMRYAASVSFAEYAFSVHGAADRHAQLLALGRDAGDAGRDLPLAGLLERAQERLARMEAGVAEEPQWLLDRLFAACGLAAPADILRAEAAVEEPPLTHTQRAALIEILAPDFALHATARDAARTAVPHPVALPQPPATPRPRMLVGTFHKTGTVLMQKILRGIAERFGQRLWFPDGKEPPPRWDIAFHGHSVFTPVMLAEPHRGVVVVRDPRDIIISGAFYHARVDSTFDRWLYNPNPRFGGRSYHEAIAAQPDDAARFVFEMDEMGGRTLRKMRMFLEPPPDFILVRFEDLTTDREMREYRRAFAWLGIPEADLPAAIEIAEAASLFSGKVKDRHVRSGRPAQWREHFTPALHAAFRERFGDLAERFGYPAE